LVYSAGGLPKVVTKGVYRVAPKNNAANRAFAGNFLYVIAANLGANTKIVQIIRRVLSAALNKRSNLGVIYTKIEQVDVFVSLKKWIANDFYDAEPRPGIMLTSRNNES
jgi:hypothetical protein